MYGSVIFDQVKCVFSGGGEEGGEGGEWRISGKENTGKLIGVVTTSNMQEYATTYNIHTFL